MALEIFSRIQNTGKRGAPFCPGTNCKQQLTTIVFEKGSSGNPAGRPVGSSNKISNTVRSVIAEVLAGTDVESLRTQLGALQGKDFIDAYVKLAEFVIPKLQRTALATEQESGRINVTLKIGGRTPEEHEANRINNSRIASHLLGKGKGG